MKIALCTTTINVPHVLNLYAPLLDEDTRAFVAGDQKTPKAAYELVLSLGHAQISMPESGHQWKCSELIGWNSIQRRNIAFLEALKWGADEIISIDDDNISLAPNSYLYENRVGQMFDGVMAHNGNFEKDWFDVGSLLDPPAKHRGLPVGYAPRRNNFTHVANAKIGVSAGVCLGDPDIDATTRIACAPEVHQVSRLLESGVVNNPHSWTVFNSQNTAVLRELVPAWGMIPFVGRMDDIYASLIVQKVMRERGLHVHFGKPFVWQSRNEHNLVKDLRGEIDGYEAVAKLADLLDHITLSGKSVLADCRRIWETLNHANWMPGRAVSAMSAYLDDCESVGCK